MNKICHRFYGGMLLSQEKWLNKMAAQGWRLIRTKKLLYEFEPCEPNQFEYRVEFIGEKSPKNAQDYASFLEDCGYRVFYKNINLNYSVGKMVIRPWAEKGGRISTSTTTLNRELLVVEKQRDGLPFELHTTYQDKLAYYRKLQRPWLYFFFSFGMVGLFLQHWTLAAVGSVALIPVLLYQITIYRLKKLAWQQEQ